MKIHTATPIETRRDLGEAGHHQPGCNRREEPGERTRIPNKSRDHSGQSKDTAANDTIDGQRRQAPTADGTNQRCLARGGHRRFVP